MLDTMDKCYGILRSISSKIIYFIKNFNDTSFWDRNEVFRPLLLNREGREGTRRRRRAPQNFTAKVAKEREDYNNVIDLSLPLFKHERPKKVLPKKIGAY